MKNFKNKGFKKGFKKNPYPNKGVKNRSKSVRTYDLSRGGFRLS